MKQFFFLLFALLAGSFISFQAAARAQAEVFDLIICQESLAHYQNEPHFFFYIYILSSPLDPLGLPRTLAAMLFVEYDGQREMVLSQSGSPKHTLVSYGPQNSHQLSLKWVHPTSALRGQIVLHPQTEGLFKKAFTGIYHGSFEAEGLFESLALSRPFTARQPGVVCTAELAQ